jgi:hypothetical protein
MADTVKTDRLAAMLHFTIFGTGVALAWSASLREIRTRIART